MEPDADGVLVELVHADGGVETVHPGVVVDAGGAHSITRHSMGEQLEGATYQGHFLVADIAMQPPFPRDQSNLVCSPDGLMLLAPLPGGRWLTFQDLEEEVQAVSAEDVAARTEVRLGGMSHHVLVFGFVADPASLARLDRRWSRFIQVSQEPDLDPARAGLPAGGVVLIRPDGHIGFRSPSTDAEALTALDRHLSSYMTPDPTV